MKKIYLFKNYRCSVLLFFIWIGLFAQTAVSQYRNSISGFVFDSQRNPISQVPVEVLNEVNQVLQRTRTNNVGRFFFSGLSAGKFSIRVTPYGTNFEDQTQEVEIINFVRPGSSTSENAQKDFYLRLKRDAKEANSVTGTIFAQDIPQEARRAYDKALSDIENNNESVAVQELLMAVKIFPDYFLALEKLGNVYIKQQNYEYARAAFTKAVSVNDRSFNSWYGLSYASCALNLSDIAVEAAQNASKIDPTSVSAFLIWGISLRQAKRYSDAEKALLQAKKFSKGQSPDVHWNLALLYNHNLKRFSDAANELEQYLKVRPDDSRAEDIKKLITQLRAKSSN